MGELGSTGGTRAARWPPAYLIGVVAAAVLSLVVVLLAGGGAPHPAPAGLPDSGSLTGWALPVARLLADGTGFLAAGAGLTAAVLLPSGRALDSVGEGLARTAAVAAGACVLAAGVEIVLTYSDFLGIPVADAVQGRVLLAQVLLMAVVVLVAASVRSTRGAAGLALIAYGAVIVPALAGHSAASNNHVLAVSSLLVHLLAASAWMGGLAGVCIVAHAGSGSLRATASRFSALALWCAVAVGASGVLNAWIRLGSVGEVVGSSYGLLVLGKLLAFGVLCTGGYLHRQRTLPALGGGSRRPFVRFAAVEVAVMCATIGLAVGLSRTPTPVQ